MPKLYVIFWICFAVCVVTLIIISTTFGILAAAEISSCPVDDTKCQNKKINNLNAYLWVLYTLDPIISLGVLAFLIVAIIYTVRQE